MGLRRLFVAWGCLDDTPWSSDERSQHGYMLQSGSPLAHTKTGPQKDRILLAKVYTQLRMNDNYSTQSHFKLTKCVVVVYNVTTSCISLDNIWIKIKNLNLNATGLKTNGLKTNAKNVKTNWRCTADLKKIIVHPKNMKTLTLMLFQTK